MTVQPTLEYRTAGTSEKWTRKDPADRISWQWHDSPDWLASEALWLIGEGCEVRMVCTGIDTSDYPNRHGIGERLAGLAADAVFGDYTTGPEAGGCLSLNPPGDDPLVPDGAHWHGKPVANAGQRNDPGTGMAPS